MPIPWIKFEASTPDKPEVWQIAEELGIDPDAVVGKLLRVWLWFDENSENGYAAIVTKSLLNRLTGVTGFAEAMERAGWLVVETERKGAKGGVIRIPNFERHNGQTAKNRALTARRMEKSRLRSPLRKSDASSDAPIVTSASPDKIRVDKKRTGDSKRLNEIVNSNLPPSVYSGGEPENRQSGEGNKPASRTDQPPVIGELERILGWTPKRVLWDDIVAQVGSKPDIGKLTACYREWERRGYNTHSLNWVDWYKAGIPPRGNGNGRQQEDRSQKQLRRLRESFGEPEPAPRDNQEGDRQKLVGKIADGDGTD